MNKVENLIRDFASSLRAVYRKEALQDVMTQLGGKTSKLADTVAPKRPRGYKRSPEELEGTKAAILKALLKKPGQRSEELQDALVLQASELTLPLSQLLSDKMLRCEGVARGRRYWVK